MSDDRKCSNAVHVFSTGFQAISIFDWLTFNVSVKSYSNILNENEKEKKINEKEKNGKKKKKNGIA